MATSIIITAHKTDLALPLFLPSVLPAQNTHAHKRGRICIGQSTRTDAPENVLMSFGGGGSSGNGNVAGDKLTLIEGSNGPRLSCYASAEPAPRFAWFQVPTQSIGGGGGGASNGPLLSRALGLIQSERSASADLAAARTATGSEWARSQLIELSGAATTTMTTTTPQTSRTYVSTLEPAAAAAMVGAGKIHRKHAGHYICEAWNAFGRQRRAAHVNVLCK